MKIHQDAALSVAKLERGQTVTTDLKKGRHGWVQVARGAVTVNGTALAEGDGAAISNEEKVTIVGERAAPKSCSSISRVSALLPLRCRAQPRKIVIA